jgi:trehalose-6-phosphate synthase
MTTNSNKITVLTQLEDYLTINICANGYYLEINGKNSDDEWTPVKYVVKTFDDLIDLVTEIDQRCRQSRGF